MNVGDECVCVCLENDALKRKCLALYFMHLYYKRHMIFFCTVCAYLFRLQQGMAWQSKAGSCLSHILDFPCVNNFSASKQTKTMTLL